MQTRSGIALGTLLLLLGLMYFGRLLPDGSAGLESVHPHEGVECGNCHSFGSKAIGGGMTRPSSQNCLSCHSPAANTDSPFHDTRVAGECADCHSFHKPELVIAAADTMSMDFAVLATALCLDCHKSSGLQPEVSAGHRQAAELIHSQRTMAMAKAPSEFCLTCHSNERSGGSEAARNAPRFHVSASHVFGQTMTAGVSRPGSAFRIQNDIPTHLSIFDGKIECQTCHSMNSDNNYLLSQTIEDGLCGSCHLRNGGDRTTLEFSLKP